MAVEMKETPKQDAAEVKDEQQQQPPPPAEMKPADAKPAESENKDAVTKMDTLPAPVTTTTTGEASGDH